MDNKNEDTRVVTGLCRFSYLHAWEPKAINEGGEAKFSVSLLIPKTDTVTLKKIERAIEAAKAAGKAKWGGKIPATLKMPLRDGDEERPGDEAYEGMYFINANAKNKPGIVDKDVNPIIDQTELYSGCWGRAGISFYAFNTNGNKGIACGLNNLQKIKDGEPLGGRVSAEVDFSDEYNDGMLD